MNAGAPKSRRTVLAAASSIVLLSATLVSVPPSVSAAATAPRRIADPAQYVNTFTGTKPGGPDFGHGGGAGNTFPGADAPFGMMQWSPDTARYQHGGYFYDDNRIRGFSLTHLSGAGCGDFGNIPFMPVLGGSPVSNYPFSHANESASPGSYAVTFDNGLKTELATTQRAGTARFTYPAGQRASLSVDAAKAFNAASGEITVGSNTLSGYSDSGGFCGTGNRYRVYFHATFDRPFTSSGIVADGKVDTGKKKVRGRSKGIAPAAPKTAKAQREARTKKTARPLDTRIAAAQAFVSFDTSANRSVTAKVGISFVSTAGAKANVDTEVGSKGLEQVRDGTRAAWNELLGRIDVTGGTDHQKRVLYTNLYHSLLHPNVFSDTDGRYIGFDRQVRTLPAGRVQYANFSGWDVYRSQIQLVALLAPKEAGDIAQSAVNQAAHGGYADRWTVANGGTGVMVGDPIAIIISSIHAMGGTNFDAADGLRRMIAGSRDGRQRPAHDRYAELSYLPAGTGGVWGSAATTLEYTSADFAVAQLAQRLGDSGNHETFMRRAQNWRNMFNSGSRYIQPRHADKNWPPFDPVQENEYVEGNAAQYHWMIPYNHRGLFDSMGGNAASISRLDTFFTELNGGPKKPYAYLGNEPTLNTPWAYAYAGVPYKTQNVVRKALTEIFKPGPDGYVGNDDLGQMASWAVWAALGMYPEAPGRAELVLASPQFPTMTVRRGNGKTITINAPGASDAARYVQSLKVNDQSSSKPWLNESFVANGGTLDFTLGTSANTSWGSGAGDAPPSFDVGPPAPRTGQISGLAGKCVDVREGNTANGVPVQIYTCNSTAAQRWTLASDGTIRALGKCLDVSQSATANGTKVQLWECNGTGAQQWWPKSGGALVSPPANRCLDVPNSNSTDGMQLQIYTCNTTNAQKWTLP